MKILSVVHDFNNFGGIISHTEQLIAGLKDLGHETGFVYLRSTKSGGKMSDDYDQKGYDIGEGTGVPVHQGKGWRGEYLSFINDADINKFVETANKYDIVIWQSIFGFKCQDSEGKQNWLRMFTDVKAKHIVIVHDGNLRKNYPWIHHLRKHIAGLACVHPSAFNQAEAMEIPRKIILNPQKITSIPQIPFAERKNVVFSLQTFKRWKRVDDLVAAVPYINGKVVIAGDGIERAYMASKDKCKPEYYCTKERDSDASDDMIGNPIWANAESAGMKYIGFVSESKRDEILSKVKFLLDPSWSKTYGEHFNRVIVDAMRQGVVPIARNLGVSDNEEGIGFFKPNENYLMIPWNATPKQFGNLINKWLTMSETDYNAIVQNNAKVIQKFDRKIVASEYVALALGLADTQTGKYLSGLDDTVDSVWCDHFGFKDRLNSADTLDSLFG
jgi:glycosyltransferase involved in cell wall biosynthesis